MKKTTIRWIILAFHIIAKTSCTVDHDIITQTDPSAPPAVTDLQRPSPAWNKHYSFLSHCESLSNFLCTINCHNWPCLTWILHWITSLTIIRVNAPHMSVDSFGVVKTLSEKVWHDATASHFSAVLINVRQHLVADVFFLKFIWQAGQWWRNKKLCTIWWP